MIQFFYYSKLYRTKTASKIDLLLAQTYYVEALANQLGIFEAAVSQHLQILRKAGPVKGEKRG